MRWNIILDIGDVLVQTRDIVFFREKGFDEQTAARLAGATYLSPYWKELDRGVWSFEKIVDRFVSTCPELEREIRFSVADLGGFIGQFDYAGDWIAELRAQGFGVYCLSNLSDKICTDCAKELDFLPMLDGYLLSYREKMVKPDPAIYRRMLEKFALRAEKCIFIDDRKENVDAAIAVGLNGFVFTDVNRAKQHIADLTR